MEFANEADCSVCSKWPEADREGMRMFIDEIPVPGRGTPVCEACFMAFCTNIMPPQEPTTH